MGKNLKQAKKLFEILNLEVLIAQKIAGIRLGCC
jgi:hypothetical protein